MDKISLSRHFKRMYNKDQSRYSDWIEDVHTIQFADMGDSIFILKH